MTQKRTISLLVCKGCGISFHPKDKKQKYHTESCREEYYNRHYFAKVEVSKTCPNCGTVFPTSKPKKQIYCKEDCREDARKKRSDAKNASVVAERETYRREIVSTLERDGYKCTKCGKGLQDGAALGVAENGASLTTVCVECRDVK